MHLMDWLAAKHLALKSVTPESVAVIPSVLGLLKLKVPSFPQTGVPDTPKVTSPPAVETVWFLQFAPGEPDPTTVDIGWPGFSIHHAARSIIQPLATGSA